MFGCFACAMRAFDDLQAAICGPWREGGGVHAVTYGGKEGEREGEGGRRRQSGTQRRQRQEKRKDEMEKVLSARYVLIRDRGTPRPDAKARPTSLSAALSPVNSTQDDPRRPHQVHLTTAARYQPSEDQSRAIGRREGGRGSCVRGRWHQGIASRGLPYVGRTRGRATGQ